MVHGLFKKKTSVKRINTKISTEEELFDVSEYLPYNLLLIFLHGQGYILWIIFFCMGRDME